MLPHSRTGAPHLILTTGHYRWLALGFLAVVLYGSLVPFQYELLPLDEALDRFRALPYLPLGIESRSDWVANILLFIPLTYLTMGAFCVDRRGTAFFVAALVVPAAVGLSLGIEFLQLYFPPRTTSLNDVVAESAGGLVGVLAWVLAGQRVTGWFRRLWTAMGRYGLAAQLLPAYVVVLVLVHVMPLDLTISPVEVYHKYKEGRVHLVPFTNHDLDAFPAAQKLFWNVAYFVPGGMLLAWLRGSAWARWPSWGRVLAVGLALAAGVEFLQLFVWTRYFDTTDIVTGALAVLAGWAAGLLASRQADETTRQGGKERSRESVSWSGDLLVCLSAVWLGVAVFATWQPFDFITDPRVVAERFRQVSLLPFADYYAGTDYNAFDQFLRKTLLFLPLGIILAPLGRRLGQGRGGCVVALAAAVVAAALEAGQLFLPARYASLTDVMVETLGAGLGFVVTSRLRLVPRLAPSPAPRRGGNSTRTVGRTVPDKGNAPQCSRARPSG